MVRCDCTHESPTLPRPAPCRSQETASVRATEWLGPPIPSDLSDRRVELTGPVSRKLVINGLNSGASVYMADFEDSTSPTWFNVIDGQINCRDAVRRTIELRVDGGRQYRLNDKTATLMVRPRGWHLIEAHIVVDGSVPRRDAPVLRQATDQTDEPTDRDS